jgi:hypothetical protein
MRVIRQAAGKDAACVAVHARLSDSAVFCEGHHAVTGNSPPELGFQTMCILIDLFILSRVMHQSDGFQKIPMRTRTTAA